MDICSALYYFYPALYHDYKWGDVNLSCVTIGIFLVQATMDW